MKYLLSILFFLATLPGMANRIIVTRGADGGAFLSGTAGDTLVLQASQGIWTWLYMGNQNGAAGNPIVIINEGDVDAHDIKIENCSYVHLTGTGTRTRTYGITFTHTAGTGWNDNNDGTTHSSAPAMHLMGLNHHIEVDNIMATESGYLIWCKVESGDYPCNTAYMWPARIHDIEIHHCYGYRMWQDGMYIGNSDPYGTSRGQICGSNLPESITTPATFPTTLNFTLDAGKGDLYRAGDKFDIINGANWITGTLTSYNATTGATVYNALGASGSFSGTGWQPKVFRRAAGLENILIHDIILDWVGRSGIQWGCADQGTNKIYNCQISHCGTELNDQQGCGIAFGSASNTAEIYSNTIRATFKNAIFSYAYGTLSIHDNVLDSSGNVPAGMFHAAGTLTMATLFFNVYNSENPGPTGYQVCNNTMTNATEGKVAHFEATQNNYGGTQQIDFSTNTYNGAAVTSSLIYVAPAATTVSYATACSGVSGGSSRYLWKLPRVKGHVKNTRNF